MQKSNISDIYSHKYAKIKINSYDNLPEEKISYHKNTVSIKDEDIDEILIPNKISCRLFTAKTWSVMGASRQSASMGSFLTIFQTCPSCRHLVNRCGGSLELCSGNKHIVKLETQLYLMALWLCRQIPAAEASVEIPGNALLISTYCHKMVCGNNRGERSQGYV